MNGQLPHAGTRQVEVIQAGPGDLDAIGQLIADAFHTVEPCCWLIPDEQARREILPAYFRIFAEDAMQHGLIHTTPDRSGAALWLPAGAEPPEPSEVYDEQLAAATGPWIGRFRTLDAQFERHHPAGIAHQHLAFLAVRPGLQGKGTGSALLAAYHRLLDEASMPAYLEAAGTRSRDLYLRHGYTLRPDAPLRLPDGPLMWPMWREPRNQPGRPAS